MVCSWDAEEATPECMIMRGNDSPCEVFIRNSEAIGKIDLVSSARLCELRRGGSYVCTMKAQQAEAGQYKLKMNIQVGHPACFSIVSCMLHSGSLK